MRAAFLFSSLLVALAVPACVIVDRGPLDRLRNGNADGGMADAPLDDSPLPVDAPVGGAADSCGDMDAELLIGTGSHDVDTTTMDADFSILATPSGGNDAFFRFHGTSGEFWHFHLAALSPDRDPVLYIVQAVDGICSSSTMFWRNACMGTEGDEHFAFQPPTTGDYFVAIDDGLVGGGRYRLQVVRPVCGNGIQEHGEPCDEGPTGSPTCSDTCRIILADTAGTGLTSVPLGRHNDTAAEAMVVAVPPTSLDVSGTIAPTDCYPDVFAVDVPAGTTLSVTARNTTSGTACAMAGDAPYSLELRNGVDSRIAGGVDGMGCPTINQFLMNEGRYYVWLFGMGDGTRPINYTLRFDTTP